MDVVYKYDCCKYRGFIIIKELVKKAALRGGVINFDMNKYYNNIEIILSHLSVKHITNEKYYNWYKNLFKWPSCQTQY